LENIGHWQSGATPNRQNPAYYNGNIPWLKTGDLNDTFIDNIPETITDLALQECSVKLNPSGSILIAMYGATIGKLGILTFPATTNQACCACSDFKGIDPTYLFYFLLQHRYEFIVEGSGGAQPNISKEKITNTFIPLPPLAEQIRIIAAIQVAFKQLNNILNSLN
jgi:type I restriction enzyme S subunit